MVKIDTKKNGLDEVLDALIKIPRGDTKVIENGSISENIISGDCGDIKINKMEIYQNLKYSTLSDYYVLLSVSNGKKYKPVLYFTKKARLNEDSLKKQEPDLDSIDTGLVDPAFSKTIKDYYLSKSLEYKFEIRYVTEGNWVEDIIKFAKIKGDSYDVLQDIFDAWLNKDKV
jgi:hypothetical protein